MGQLLFKKCFWPAIRSGAKRTTLRRWSRPRVTAGGRAYAPGVGWLSVRSVGAVELASLGEADARADGFESLADMLAALRSMYPAHDRDGKRWYRVTFACEAKGAAAAGKGRRAKGEGRSKPRRRK